METDLNVKEERIASKNCVQYLDGEDICKTNNEEIEDLNIDEQFIDDNEVLDRETWRIKNEYVNSKIPPQRSANDSANKLFSTINVEKINRNEVNVSNICIQDSQVLSDAPSTCGCDTYEYISSFQKMLDNQINKHLEQIRQRCKQKSKLNDIIDWELLTRSVKERPLLWNKFLDIYTNKIGKTVAWREVCLILKEDFEEMALEDLEHSESSIEFSDDSIDDPIFQPEEENEECSSEETDSADKPSSSKSEAIKQCSSEQTDLPDEPSSSNSKAFIISDNLLGRSIDTTINTCDDENLTVPACQDSGGGGKKNVCPFCHKKQAKLSRHLSNVHKDEEEVKNFEKFPKGCKERRCIIGLLRNRGNFYYNTRASLNDGNLIVSRRPNIKKLRKAKDYLPCANCKGFYSKNSLRRHFRICTGSSAKNRGILIAARKIAGRLHSSASKIVREKLFPTLRDDDIVRPIRYDELVILYANKMCEKYRSERHYEMIRQRIRLIGRFLKTLKEINKDIQNLTDVFDPKFCQDAMRAINLVAGANEDTGLFLTPSNATSLGYLVKCISTILINRCIIRHDDTRRKKAKNFLLLFTQEIEINVTRKVTETSIHIRGQKTVGLPLTNALRKSSRDILQVPKLLDVAQGMNEEEKENNKHEINEEEKPEDKPRMTSSYGPILRRRWTADEIATVLNAFAGNIECGTLPSFTQIEELKSQCSFLNQRSAPQIKTWIHNQIRKQKQLKFRHWE